jgi:hypothetical protein
VEGDQDQTLPPVDRQKKKLGNLSTLFCDAHGYGATKKVVKKEAVKRKFDGTG